MMRLLHRICLVLMFSVVFVPDIASAQEAADTQKILKIITIERQPFAIITD